MKLLRVRFWQIGYGDLGDHTSPKMVGSDGVDANSTVFVLVSERDLVDESEVGVKKGV